MVVRRYRVYRDTADDSRIMVYLLYHVNKVERTTLGSHDLALSIFQIFLPISRSLSKCKISNTLTAISREVLLIPYKRCRPSLRADGSCTAELWISKVVMNMRVRTLHKDL